MDIQKPNDIFVTSTLVPDLNIHDLLKSNIVADNTALLDKDSYKNTEFVKKEYTNDQGVFDDIKFNAAYDKAASLYTDLSNTNYLKNNIEYDPYDFYRPIDSKVKHPSLIIEKDINPYKNIYGRTGFDSIDKGELSVRELSQKSNIFDPEIGKFIDKTPNDLGLFGSLFDDTLVYAKWDEDGYHSDPNTKREVFHSKGENKLNPDGNFYTEYLRDREVYGKEVVNPTDLITTDKSFFNGIDYFDSDGKEKSVIGTTFKVATEIAPFFIPGVNLYYGGFKMAMGLSSVMPTFYKSLEGLILGDSTVGNETDLWKAATKAEGFMAKYNTDSYSDEGSKNMWNYEQLGNMVGSIFSQIHEQRAAANLSKLFYRANKLDAEKYAKLSEGILTDVAKGTYAGTIVEESVESITKKAALKAQELAGIGKKQSNLAKSLSLSYMALTSTADIYHEAIAGGFDRRAAGFAALVAAAGQYGIMTNNRMSTWFLDEAVGFNAEANKLAVREAILPKLKDIAKGFTVSDTDEKLGRSMLASTISSIKKLLYEPIAARSALQKVYKNGIVEGVEEVTEQMILDATKGTMDTLSWLGVFNKKGSFKTMDNVFSKKGLENYLVNFVGGVIGGGIFELNRVDTKTLFDKSIKTSDDYALLRGIANGKGNEYRAEASKMIKNLGISNLSPTPSSSEKENVIYSSPTDNVNQSDVILGAFNKYIDHLEYLVNTENLAQDNNTLIKKTILDEITINRIKETGVDNYIISDFNILSGDIINLRTDIEKLNKEKDSTQISELNLKLKEKQEERDAFLNGDKSLYYRKLSTFALNKSLHEPFISLNVQDYVKSKYNVEYNTLSDSGGTLNKNKVNEDFKNLMESPDRREDKIKFMYEAFETMVGKYSEDISKYADEKHINSREEREKRLQTVKILTPESVKSIQKGLSEASLTPYNLSDIINIPLGQLLAESNKIDFSGLTEEEKNAQIESLNKLEIPVQDLSLDFIQNIAIGTHSQKIIPLEQELADLSLREELTPEEKVIRGNELILEIKNLNKLIPSWNKSESKRNKLNLDSIYLYQQLKDKPYITSEEAEIIKNRKDQLFNKTKNDLKNYLIDGVSLEGLFFSPEEIQQLDEVKTYKELNNFYNNVIGKIKLVDKSIGLTDEDIEFEINMVPTVNPDIENSEKLLNKDILDNQFLNILKTMNLDIFSNKDPNKLNVFDIVQSELKQFELRPKTQDYVRSDEVIESMKQAKSVIGLVRSISVAMLDTPVDVMTPFSFTTLIKSSLKNEGKETDASKFATINGDAYHLLNKELGRIETKLNYLIELAESNSETIINKDKKTKTNSIELLYSGIIDGISESSPLNLKINGVPLLTQEDINKEESSDRSIEEKLANLEEVIYNNFNNNFKGSEEELDDLFKSYISNPKNTEIVLENKTSAMSSDSTYIPDKNWIIHLHAIIATNSKEFYQKYKDVLKNELPLSDKKVPFYTQEYNLRLTYSYLNNKSIMTHALRFLNKNRGLNETSHITLDNLWMITGVGGVGKTTISNFILKMLDKEKVTIAGPNSRVYKNLETAIKRNVDKETTVGTSEDIFKILGLEKLYKEYAEDYAKLKAYANPPVGQTTKLDKPISKFFTITNLEKVDIKLTEDFKNKLIAAANTIQSKHVLFYDEVSWMNYLDLQIFNTLVSNPNISFIGLGDTTQKGYNLSTSLPFSLEITNFLSGPKLIGVVRSNNIHQSDNIGILSFLVENIKSDSWKPKFTTEINYSQIDGILNGDKFVDSLSDSDLKLLDNNKEVAIINDDGKEDEDLRNRLKGLGFNNILFISNNDIQGEQFEQVIFTGTIPYKDDWKFIPKRSSFIDLQTLIGRAKQSMIIVKNKEILDFIQAINVEKKYTGNINFTLEELDSELGDRLEMLEKLSGITKEIKPEIKPEVPKKVITIGNPFNDPEIEDDTDTEILEKEESLDGDKRYMTYSFYNVLHAKIDNNKLKVKDLSNKIPSDLQIIRKQKDASNKEVNPIIQIKDESNPKKLVSDFIHVKNILLHNIAGLKYAGTNLGENPFAKILQAKDGKVVVRKLMVDNNFVKTYGKQAHIDKPKTGEQLFLCYKATIDEKPFYITLSALPDVSNPMYKDKKNKTFLLDTFTEEEVEIKDFKLNAYSGIRRIYNNGKTIKPDEDNPIKITGNTFEEFIENLKEIAPGIQISESDKIEVFNNTNLDKIQEVFTTVGYKLNSKGKVIKNTLKNPEYFRARPYIKVSYTDVNNDEQSRIITLSAKSRPLSEALVEFGEANRIVTDDPTLFKDNLVPLISDYQGAVLLSNLLNKGTKETKDNIVKAIIENQKNLVNTRRKIFTNDVDEPKLKGILEILYKAKGNIKSLSSEDKTSIFKSDARNVGFILLDILNSNEEIRKMIEDPTVNDINLNTKVYYDPAWVSTHSERTSGAIKANDIKYYKMNTYLEPPIFMLDLSNFKKGEPSVSTLIPAQIKPIPIPTNTLVTLDQDVLIDTPIGEITLSNTIASKWDITNLNKAVFVLNSLLETIDKNTIGQLNKLEKEEIDTINTEIYTLLISNSNLIKSNGNFNSEMIPIAWKNSKTLSSKRLTINTSNLLGKDLKIISKIQDSWNADTNRMLIKNKCN